VFCKMVEQGSRTLSMLDEYVIMCDDLYAQRKDLDAFAKPKTEIDELESMDIPKYRIILFGGEIMVIGGKKQVYLCNTLMDACMFWVSRVCYNATWVTSTAAFLHYINTGEGLRAS